MRGFKGLHNDLSDLLNVVLTPPPWGRGVGSVSMSVMSKRPHLQSKLFKDSSQNQIRTRMSPPCS